MRSERGYAALWVIGALAVSSAVGVGVYVVIKEQRAEDAANDRQTIIDTEPDPVPDVAPHAPTSTEPAEAPVAAAVPVAPVDRADAEAVDPELGSEPPTGAPTFGTPGIDGALDKEGVAIAVRAASTRLQRCFEKRLAAGAQLGGTVRVTLLVNRRGGVTTATASGVDDELATCTATVLKDVRLPRTTDGNLAKVVYPIAFRAADGTTADLAPSRPDVPAGPCDEVACVLDNYEGPCCAKFKRPSTPEAPAREELLAAQRALRGKVMACASAHEFTGILTVTFAVLPTGKVGKATIADVVPALGSCIVRAFKAYAFPASVNGITASFPFNVSPP